MLVTISGGKLNCLNILENTRWVPSLSFLKYLLDYFFVVSWPKYVTVGALGKIGDGYKLFGRGRHYLCLGFDENGGKSGEGFLFEACFDDFVAGFLHMACTNMSDFDLFGHADDADWFFLGPDGSAIVEIHDGFFEYVQEGLFAVGMSIGVIGDIWKEVTTFKAEFGSEKCLFGVVPVLVIELCLEGHIL